MNRTGPISAFEGNLVEGWSQEVREVTVCSDESAEVFWAIEVLGDQEE